MWFCFVLFFFLHILFFSSSKSFVHFYFIARSCLIPLGIESGRLPDSAFSASSSASSNHLPPLSRLNKVHAKTKVGAWCAGRNDGNQWLQVDFGRETTVTKVATQGTFGGEGRVTSYILSYSSNGIHWAAYRLTNGAVKVWELVC